MEATVQALRRIPLFSALSDTVLESVARAVTRRVYDAGAIILDEGAPCRETFFIAEGVVRVYRTSMGGREQVLAQLGPGQAFNTVPPFRTGCVNHAAAQAMTPVVLYAVSCTDFRDLVGESSELALAVLEDFAARLDQLTDLVEDLSLRTVRARLARFLLEYVGEEQTPHRWTQEDIAARVGTVRDMIGRTLRAFADEGLVRMERQRVVLLDRKGLEEAAQL